MDLTEFLAQIVERNASDGFATVGSVPTYKVDGELIGVGETALESEDVTALIIASMSGDQFEHYLNSHDANYAIEHPDLGRFRASAYVQREQPGLVVRRIHHDIPNFDVLGLPSQLKRLSLLKRGLVIVVGATGSGKSTTLAAMVDYRNRNRRDHIITVEDPIEYVHQHQQSIISQREVGVDTRSWHNALKNTLRQAPDVILIGEIRDRETMEHAISFAETGHLCISTLHANNANQALDRIINFFPEERRSQLLLDLSLNLQAFVSQRLIPNIEGGRSCAVEVLLGSPTVKELILRGEIAGIKEIMEKSEEIGMMTFDKALFDLHQAGLISEEEALRNADSANNLRLRIKLAREGGVASATGGLTLEGDDETPPKVY